ncbi:glycosyltransferase family 8 protein [Sphingomonas sp. CV7422]|uniref:glycosyltransferase family 8 protein n=1 Tax=Sphingomonas sp. CV7422 TaxID=3018036 RepID=UPI0022FDDE36|nr:glycosyltransferase [Sphingomonas sp. CV7422]
MRDASPPPLHDHIDGAGASGTQSGRKGIFVTVNASPTRSCICYIANQGYLYQSLVSAIQARQHSPAHWDVIVFDMTAVPGEESRRIAHVCAAKGVEYRWADPAILGGLHIMNARLFLDELLPADYVQILYLDGDTQVVGDLNPLLDFQPQPGGLCAVRDPMIYLRGVDRLRGEFEDEIRAFGDDYVNSGVFRADRASWATISRKALAQMGNATSALHFEDQTVINRVTTGRRNYASLRWNFPGFILGYGLDTIAPPAIVHFMSNPRPWQGAYAPWGRSWNIPYLALAREFPEIKEYCAALDLRRRAAYKVKQIAKSYVERRLWNAPELLNHIRRLEDRADV